MTTTSLDDLILSAATKEPQKSAVLISKVFDNPAFDKETNKAQDVAERIYILVDNGKLEATGNMRRWRDSTICLPAGKKEQTRLGLFKSKPL